MHPDEVQVLLDLDVLVRLGHAAGKGTAQGADVPGHLFGLLAGAVLALVAGLARPRPLAPPIEWALVAAAAALVIACWWIA